MFWEAGVATDPLMYDAKRKELKEACLAAYTWIETSLRKQKRH